MKNTVFLSATIRQGYGVTMCSKRIGYPFRLKRIRVYFPIGSDMEMQVTPVLAQDKTVPDDVMPTGTQLLSMLGNQAWVCGTAEMIEFEYDIIFESAGTYLKAYCLNSSFVDDHRVRILFEVESVKKGDV